MTHLVRDCFLVLGFLCGAAAPAQEAAATKRPNIVFLIADDLGAQALACYGNTQCKTPAIDSIAARGVRFTRAYCQFPVCGPSRAALMSGMYCEAIGVMGNGQAKKFTANIGERPTMSSHFLRNGWHAARVSKIYHMRVPGDITNGVHGPDHAASWSERHSFKAPEWMSAGSKEHLSRERLRFDKDKHYNLGFGGAFYVVRGSTDGAEQADVLAADKAIEILGTKRDKPLFLAVGFVRPHVPLVAPAKYFEPYKAGAMRLPERVDGDWDDIPKLGLSKNSERTGLSTDAKKKRVLAAYYACVAFMDAQVARVLKAIDDNGLRDNTIVVFTSDHGYHLGEHEFWQKMSLHEESVRIPLVIAGPGVKKSETAALAQQIDIYPTLSALADLPVPKHVQGKSLKPAIDDPKAAVHDLVYCTKRRGRMIRTNRWAFLSWPDGSAELYDMRDDPKQFTNLAEDPQHAKTVAALRQRLANKVQSITN